MVRTKMKLKTLIATLTLFLYSLPTYAYIGGDYGSGTTTDQFFLGLTAIAAVVFIIKFIKEKL